MAKKMPGVKQDDTEHILGRLDEKAISTRDRPAHLQNDLLDMDDYGEYSVCVLLGQYVELSYSYERKAVSWVGIWWRESSIPCGNVSTRHHTSSRSFVTVLRCTLPTKSVLTKAILVLNALLPIPQYHGAKDGSSIMRTCVVDPESTKNKILHNVEAAYDRQLTKTQRFDQSVAKSMDGNMGLSAPQSANEEHPQPSILEGKLKPYQIKVRFPTHNWPAWVVTVFH